MDGTAARKGTVGFTLIELMIVLIIGSVLVSIGAPGMQRLRDTIRMRTEVSRLMTDILLTRSEAIKRNRSVIMCPSMIATSAEANCEGAFAQGWVIFVDTDRNRILSPSDRVIKMARGLGEDISLTNRSASRAADEAIHFRPDGTSRRNRTLMLCSGRNPQMQSWSVVMNMIGRPRVARGWGRCPIG